jgi:hypothetical protein
MSRKLEEKGTRIHLVLYDRDIERINRYFSAPMRPGAKAYKRSEAVRLIVGKFLDQVEAKAQERNFPVAPKLLADEI